MSKRKDKGSEVGQDSCTRMSGENGIGLSTKEQKELELTEEDAVTKEERLNHLYNQAMKNAKLIDVLKRPNKKKDMLIQTLEKLLNDQ